MRSTKSKRTADMLRKLVCRRICSCKLLDGGMVRTEREREKD